MSRLSYVSILKKYLRLIRPKKILEFGPGDSTGIMLAESDAHVYAREHSERWYKCALDRFGDNPRFNVVQESIVRVHSYYVVGALKDGPYDMIFVDGRRRVECCMWGLEMLTHNGVVILHDAQRIHYRVIRPYIRIIDQEDNGQTIVFRKLV